MTPRYYSAGLRYGGCGHKHRSIKGAEPCLARLIALRRGVEPVRVLGIWGWRKGDQKPARWLRKVRVA